jgi:hypothetical protein
MTRGSCAAAKTPFAPDAKEQHEGEARPPKQYTPELLAFVWAQIEDGERLADMEDKDVVQEYLRAGKLHTYDPDKEAEKRFGRVAKLHPWAWPKHMVEQIEQCIKYLDEEEDDYRMGLYSLLGDEIRD